MTSKTLGELDRALAALAERPRSLAETDETPRGREPALFRAARAVAADEALAPDERAAALERVARALGERLPDRPLVDPALELARDVAPIGEILSGAWRARGTAPDAWASEKMAGALAPLGDVLAVARALLAREADAIAPSPAGRAALRALLDARLATSAARRDRTSTDLALGALALLPPDDPLLLARVVESEARRAGKEEPELAIAALDALAHVPPLARLRTTQVLERRIERRKVVDRIRELASAAAAELELDPDTRALLLADEAGLDRDARATFTLEAGEARLSIGDDGAPRVEAPDKLDADDRREVDGRVAAVVRVRDELATRLERAMVEGRSIPHHLFREIALGDHGVLRDLARRIVWLALAPDATAGTAFRPIEGGLEDVFGEKAPEPAALAGEKARVRPAHPIELDPAELDLWRERVVSLGLAQPFEQLFRPGAGAALDAFARREARRDELAAAARERGWRGLPLRGDGPWEIARDFPGRATVAVVELEPPPAPARKPGEKAPPPSRDPAPRVVVARARLEGAPDRVALAETQAFLHEVTDEIATGGEAFFLEWQKRRWRDPGAAWKEALDRYARASSALVARRKALLAALGGPKVEDRFALVGPWRVELATGNVHEGEGDLVPAWRAKELARPARLRWHSGRRDPIVELVLGLAAAQGSPDPKGSS
jgi:hypothetical protein